MISILGAVAGGGSAPPIWSVLPFAALLLSIAVLPLVAHHWWESNRNKGIVAAICGVPIALWLLWFDWHALAHHMLEYLAFIALLGSLFVISGGIFVHGSFAGTPLVNTIFLGIGSVLASFLGTTGASMVLIRPLLRANKKRRHKVHIIIFFIFIVSNVGGCLTPLGDPPLFLGFLKGVPFLWTFGLWRYWLIVNAALLVLFNLFDQYKFNKEDVETKGSLVEDVQPRRALGIEGAINILLLFGVVATVFCSGQFIYPAVKARAAEGSAIPDVVSMGAQICLMTVLALLSLKWTPKRIHEKNEFTWHPIAEVAVLFAGIFAAMTPAVLLLHAEGESFGLTQNWQYFWLTGSLSSFLDNAPTYVVFLALGQSVGHIPDALPDVSTANMALVAIATGAVFMGAMTYIGNGPNFMVKAIAESDKIRMPSFFGYMLWSILILVPLYVVLTLIFFTGSSEVVPEPSGAAPH